MFLGLLKMLMGLVLLPIRILIGLSKMALALALPVLAMMAFRKMMRK